MNPIHYQFLSTSPYPHDQYNVHRLFELLDLFDVKHRDSVLMHAYICFDLGELHDGSSVEAARELRYQNFKRVFAETTRLHCTTDDQPWREAYSVYGLVSFLLVEAFKRRESDVYLSLRFNIEKEFTQFHEALEGDDGARRRAMEWSVKVLKQLELVRDAKFTRGVAYSSFCERVVEPLLLGPDTD